MTQIEFDAAMSQLNYEQGIDNQKYNDKKIVIDTEINDIKLQILALRSRIQELHIAKMAIQTEQKKANQEWHEKKHQLCILNPRESSVC